MDRLVEIRNIRYKLEKLPTVGFFEHQIKLRRIKRWDIHNCSICNYLCGFVFEIIEDRVNVYYDAGCYCVKLDELYSNRSIKDIIEYIRLQSNLDYINECKRFWKIKSRIIENNFEF